MMELNKPLVSRNMVNYTNVLTSIPNEVYVSSTDTPESLAFLIKNKFIVDLSFLPIAEENNSPKSEKMSTDASCLII